MLKREELKVGLRVRTRLGYGSVGWWRLGATDKIVTAVSVVLDEKRDRPTYRGTVISAKDVQLLEEQAIAS